MDAKCLRKYIFFRLRNYVVWNSSVATPQIPGQLQLLKYFPSRIFLLTVCGSHFYSIFVRSFQQSPGVKLLNVNSFLFFLFHFDSFRNSRNKQNGCWNRGLTTRTKWCWLSRYWPQGAPKSFNITTVDRCVKTTASCLCSKGPQNLWNEEESQRDSWWLKHDRTKGYNVSYDFDSSFNVLPFPLALLTSLISRWYEKLPGNKVWLAIKKRHVVQLKKIAAQGFLRDLRCKLSALAMKRRKKKGSLVSSLKCHWRALNCN